MKNQLSPHSFSITGLILSAILLFSFTLPNGNETKENKKSESMPIYGNWKTFGKKDGLPSDKIYAVRADEDRVWVGTNQGLALLEDGKWTV